MRRVQLTRLATVLATLFLFSLHVFAQNRVTGTVTDPTGKGVAGATVTVKGTNNATSTNEAGSFTITAPGGGTLVISAVGFGTQEVPVQNRTDVSVRMTTQESNLNEVVVIGYGTARRRDLTGAVATVNEKNFNKGVFTSPDQLIQGKVSGVQITNNSGQPGGGTTIRIRGASALTGTGNPLFVVDGVPLDNTTARPGLGDIGVGGSNPGANPLNFLNPSDIVSMDILKDASATAIYGSRGAYGVVLITTKKGQSGQPKIDFNASYGVSNVMKQIRVLDAGEFREALSYYGWAMPMIGVEMWTHLMRLPAKALCRTTTWPSVVAPTMPGSVFL
jgi:iron complex outermembrane receptor protein